MPKKVRAWFRIFIKLALLSSFCLWASGTSLAAPSTEGIQIYQKNNQFSPEHKQKIADDINRYRNADNLWNVLREEFALPHYENNPAVQEKIEWFMNNQDFLLRSASRAAPYLYYILQQIKARHLPAELVLLPIIESGYNPFSRSPVGAVGIWQLMPNTATDLGVRQDWWYDGRRDMIVSTRAALNHLAYLQSFFEGNWLLAIAAYNTGEGNVLSAIKRNIRDGLDTDFWSLPVAQQTKDYVPSLLALAVIISKPEQYPIYFPPVQNAPYLAQVDVGEQINLKYAANLAGISYKKLMQLNSGFNRPSTSSNGPHKLVLPIENVEQFTENLARSPLNRQVNWIHYKVKSGDTLASISKKFGTTTRDIRRMNHLSKGNLRPNTNLLIPHQEMMTQDEEAFDNTANLVLNSIKKKERRAQDFISLQALDKSTEKYTIQPGDTIYMVRAQDSVESISRHFRISSLSLRRANQLNGNKIKPGKQIIIPTHTAQLSDANTAPPKAKKINPGDTLYMVRRGDTVEEIARKFNASPAAIRIINFVDNDSLIVGDKLVIPTHYRS